MTILGSQGRDRGKPRIKVQGQIPKQSPKGNRRVEEAPSRGAGMSLETRNAVDGLRE